MPPSPIRMQNRLLDEDLEIDGVIARIQIMMENKRILVRGFFGDSTRESGISGTNRGHLSLSC
jgi:hypothetical protein